MFCKNLIYVFLAVIVFMPTLVSAAVMSSDNYQMGTNSIGSGVFETQSSASYIIEYPWQDTTVSGTVTTETATTEGGGILGSIGAGRIPSHINAFNIPLVLTEEQSGTLTCNFYDDILVVVNVPKGITSNGVTIIVSTEIESTANKYLIPQEFGLTDNIFYNIIAFDSNGGFIHQLDEYITITFKIPSLLIGAKKTGVYFLDENISRWVLIPDVVFNETIITFNVNHLTKFALFSQSTSQEIPNILEIPFLAKKVEVRRIDSIEPEGPKRIERLFDTSSDVDDAQAVNTKEEEQSLSWKFWAFFPTLIVIYFVSNIRKKRKVY